MVTPHKFDAWLQDEGPAAITMHELLEPVEGPEAPIFPPTFAPHEDKSKFEGGYNIDVFPADESAVAAVKAAMLTSGRIRPLVDFFPTSPNVCLIDSVGSQANRIEPIFSKPRYRSLVPQIDVIVGDSQISLLDAGHRAGDALVRFTKAGEELWAAFKSLATNKNAIPLAKIAPTSIVFGVWDSRGSQVKVPRSFRATIRAYNVRKLSRSAQFSRAINFVEHGAVDEGLDAGSGDTNPLSRDGLNDNPASCTHGGVIVKGDIVREVTINLAALRRLSAGLSGRKDSDADADLQLRRYILGLALVSATVSGDDIYSLREGCHLKTKGGNSATWRLVHYNSADEPINDLTHDSALTFAKEAAAEFEVGSSGEFVFDKSAANGWLKLTKEQQDSRRRKLPMTRQNELDHEEPDGPVKRRSRSPKK